MRVFLWVSFLYYSAASISDVSNHNDIDGFLSNAQEQELYSELSNLSEHQRKVLLEDLKKQAKDFDQSRSKWSKLRQTLPYSEEPSVASQSDIDSIRRTIRSGGNPVIRNKRTLKFLVKSLSEILGLRWTLLKYSLIPAAVNTFIGPPPPGSPAVPAPPAPANPPAKPGAPPAAAPKRTLPPPRRPPPPPPPPAAPPARPPAPPAKPPALPAKPAAAPAAPPARPPPPTIPPNQIDANTIRYPFRPAPTIPFLNFAPLPPGVTVPYPPLFQWPAPAAPAPPGPAPAIPSQPPCAAPPPAPPKARPPSILPLPKPRAPVPPPPKPVAPILPASPGKTPLKLEYDHPVRIEIFNNVKPFLPASSSVYSGEPSLASLEEQDERNNENFLVPTRAFNIIDEQYNTEPAQSYNDDNDYGFLKDVPNSYHNPDEQTTDVSSYSDNGRKNDERYYNDEQDHLRDNNEPSRYDLYDDRENHEETTPENYYKESQDYPEVAEENRAHVNVKVNHFFKNDATVSPKYLKYKKTPKKTEKSKKIHSKSSSLKNGRNWGKQTKPNYGEINVKVSSTSATVLSTGIPKKSRRLPRPNRQSDRKAEIVTNVPNEFPHNNNYGSFENNFPSKVFVPPHSSFVPTPHNNYSANNFFRIVVPNDPARKRRDIFFDDAFKSFNLSAFESFNKEDAPESTQAQFLETDGGKLIPDLDYRKSLEKDIEKYVEQYVEQQITKGEIDTKKPKITIVELKSKDGTPIKTVTTTISKLVDGDKSFLESVVDFSKNINPVSNIAEIAEGAEGEPSSQSTKPSEVAQAFKNENEPSLFNDAFSWNFAS